MVLIMNLLKSKRVDKPRHSLKVVEYDMEGSVSKKGYDSKTKDDVEGGSMSLKGGVGCNSQNKNKKVRGSDSNQNSDCDEG